MATIQETNTKILKLATDIAETSHKKYTKDSSVINGRLSISALSLMLRTNREIKNSSK